jgi:molybdate transport system regulatory protein
LGSRLSISLGLAFGAEIGPGQIAALEEIACGGSISAASKVLRSSNRRIRESVEELNRSSGTPLVATAVGGIGGGGATLTRAGEAVVRLYRAIEVDAARVARKHLLALERICTEQIASRQKQEVAQRSRPPVTKSPARFRP